MDAECANTNQGELKEIEQRPTRTVPTNVFLHPMVISLIEEELNLLRSTATPFPKKRSAVTVRAGPSWAEPSSSHYAEDLTLTHPRKIGRHHLAGNVAEAAELALQRRSSVFRHQHNVHVSGATDLGLRGSSSVFQHQLGGNVSAATELALQGRSSDFQHPFFGEVSPATELALQGRSSDFQQQFFGYVTQASELALQGRSSDFQQQFFGYVTQASELALQGRSSDFQHQLFGDVSQATEMALQSRSSVLRYPLGGDMSQAVFQHQLGGEVSAGTELALPGYSSGSWDQLGEYVADAEQLGFNVSHSVEVGFEASETEQLGFHILDAEQHVGHVSQATKRGQDNIDETQPPPSKRQRTDGNEYNRGKSPEDSSFRWRPLSYTQYRNIELVTQASTITYPTPTYTEPPWPTPTYLNLPGPALAYPSPILQNPTSSQLVQGQNICQARNPYFPPTTPPQIRPCSPPHLPNFQALPLSTPGSPPQLRHLVRPKPLHRLLDNQQQSTKPQPTNLPTYSAYLINRSTALANSRPIPRLIPITLPIKRVYSGSLESRIPIRSSPIHTVTSTSPSAVDIQSFNLLQFGNTENETTTNQNVASEDSSLHSLVQTWPRQNHWSPVSPDLNEHEEYQLWPGADIFVADNTGKVSPLPETTEYDEWLSGPSPSSTVVSDKPQEPAPLPTSSSDAIVPVPPLTPATPSVTKPSPEEAKRQQK